MDGGKHAPTKLYEKTTRMKLSEKYLISILPDVKAESAIISMKEIKIYGEIKDLEGSMFAMEYSMKNITWDQDKEVLKATIIECKNELNRIDERENISL